MDHPARLAEPGQVFTWHEPDGTARTLTADAAGVVRPTDAASAAIAEAFDLPLAPPKGRARPAQTAGEPAQED